MDDKNLQQIDEMAVVKPVTLTKEQERAIKAKGLVMVSASAGSGKTHTMLERIIHLIDEGVSLDKMLILVYNEANASELREKIRGKLFEMACESIGEKAEVYRKQLDEIAFSTICTIHAFCRSALKKNFEAIGINPDFDILDETAHKVYINKALDKTIEEYAENGDDKFLEMLSIFESKRTEENIRDNVVKLYERMDVQSSLEDFINAIKDNYSSRQKFDDIIWNRAIDKFHKIVAVARSIYPVIEKENVKGYIKRFCDIFDMEAYFDSRDAKNIREKFEEIKSQRPTIKKELSVATTAKKCSSSAKDLMEEISILYADNNYCNKVFEQNKAYVEKLVEITLHFKETLEKMKESDNVMSFSDLEHGAVKLINNGVDIGEDYDYVFVDEYQDVNGAQEYIIKHLVKKEAFMVGDVKQSIYGFRLSNPEIFLARQDYYENHQEDGIIEAPIFFKDNFRSDNAVLKFVNDIFDYAMTVESAGVNYTKEGRFNEVSKEERREGKVEVHIFEDEDNETKDAEGLYKLQEHSNAEKVKSAEEQEGEFIAKKILELRSSACFTLKKKKPDDKDKRQLDWDDFAILFRGRNRVSNTIIEVLKRNGIPVDEGSFAKENDPAETEFVNMLQVIDNPRQDYALAGYMLSYLGGYTEDELNVIVQYAKEVQSQEQGKKRVPLDLYDKVLMCGKLADDLADKINKTLATLKGYRVVGSYMSVKGLVERIIADTGYDAYLYSKSEAIGNSFNSYLKSISEDSVTLSKYLREYKEGGRETKGRTEGGDRVQVSTMHSYKGLEKPVIFLPGSNFVPTKITKEKHIKSSDGVTLPDLSLDANGAIGMSYFDVDGRMKDSNTVSNKAIQILSFEKEHREEMRLLYVALTRAQKNMYITGTCSTKEGKDRLPFNVENVSKKFVCEPFESEMNLLSYVFTAINRGTLTDCNLTLHPSRQEKAEAQCSQPFYEIIGEKTAFEKELAKAIENAQNFKYAHDDETRFSMKYSVTAINAEEMKDLSPTFPTHEDDAHDEYDVSITTVGTTYHKIMEHIDFALDNLADVTSAIDKMVEDGIITADLRAIVKDHEVLSALMNPIIKECAGERCYHEQPFVMYVPAKDVFDNTNSTDKVLVQGVIDLLVDGKKKYIIDFKYSSLSSAEARERYKKQLNLYKMAYKVSFGKEIDKIVLLSLKNGESFEL